MYLAGHWHTVTLKAPGRRRLTELIALDVSLLHDQMLAPLLGSATCGWTSESISGGRPGTSALARAVDGGRAAVAFSMYPVAVADLMAISDAGEHHAAEIHMVRAKAAGWLVDPRDLTVVNHRDTETRRRTRLFGVARRLETTAPRPGITEILYGFCASLCSVPL